MESAWIWMCGGFNLHVGQRDLSDRGQVADGVQRVLGEVGDCAEVGVQQTPRNVQRVLPGPPETLQHAQPRPALNRTGQLQLYPAASHNNPRGNSLQQTNRTALSCKASTSSPVKNLH